jgi:hypothetical protein
MVMRGPRAARANRTAGDGSAHDGASRDGSTDDGSTDDGSTDDGSTDDGSTDDGSTDDGSTDDGRPVGLFIGLTTLDTIYRVRRPPLADEKIVADDLVTAAGGPATGAAVTFAHLGGRAVLLSAVGAGPLAAAVRADLAAVGVRSLDLRPGEAALPISAIMVSTPGGQRAVVSAHGALPGAATGTAPALPAGTDLAATPDLLATPGPARRN